MKQVLTIGILK